MLELFNQLKEEGIPQGLLKKLNIEDKVCLALVHLHLLHTRVFPHSVVGCHGNHIPIRIVTKVHNNCIDFNVIDKYFFLQKPFFIPWKQEKLSQKEFDETMAVFRSKLIQSNYKTRMCIISQLILMVNQLSKF